MKVITNHLIPYMKDYQNKGWVRLHRKIEDNPLWLMEPFTKAQSWIDLFLNANYKDGQISIRGNFVLIKRGQIGWSELTMARRWRWSKNKVRRFLKWLETEQQIVQQKDRYLTTIITILNYETYQNDTADDTAERQQTIHKQEVKKEKKENKETIHSEEYGKFIEYWNKIFDRDFKATPSLLPYFIHWRQTYSMKEIGVAIKNAKSDDYWSDKITPTIFLRKKNPQGEPVDYIGRFINKERKMFNLKGGEK